MNTEVEHIAGNLYLKDEYIAKNPSLHEIDTSWKITKIKPLIDEFVKDEENKSQINVLDVGGGAGIILSEISAYVTQKYGLKVNKFILDMSPGMLEIQKKRNPDVKKVLHEDICKTSLRNKEIDLLLMIDVLEHTLNPIHALSEIKRISKYAIFKVPLEDNFSYNLYNRLSRDKIKKCGIDKAGHINFYNFKKLKRQVEASAGSIERFYFTNVYRYLLGSSYYKEKMTLKNKVINMIAQYIFKLSPQMSAALFNDHVMLLVKNS